MNSSFRLVLRLPACGSPAGNVVPEGAGHGARRPRESVSAKAAICHVDRSHDGVTYNYDPVAGDICLIST